VIFRAPLPPSIQDILKKRIRHLHLATNPVRLQYCTQEIVIFREDLLQKLCRYCIKLPADNLPTHVRFFSFPNPTIKILVFPFQLCHTLITQAHLSPLPVYMTPIYWAYDHALHLYPLPDLIVVCDKFKSITDTIADCTIINPVICR
jgi:DNA polymerase epsilon subunit 2